MGTGDIYVTSSTYIEGAIQSDGRRHITEYHVTDDQTYVYEYLCDDILDPAIVLEERAKKVSAILHARELARQAVAGTSVPLTRFEFLSRFTPAERVAIREIAKTDAIVEDFMEMMKLSGNVSLVLARPGLNYLALKGCITPARASEIGAE